MRAQMTRDKNTAIKVPAGMRHGSVSNIGGMNALGKQREGVEKVQILCVVVEPEDRFDFAAPHSYQGLKL